MHLSSIIGSRLVFRLALVTVAATIVVPAAGAGNGAGGQQGPDLVERYLRSHQQATPDVIERYLRSHRQVRLVDGRSPDTLDAVAAAQPILAPSDGRSADTRDAVGAPQLPVVAVAHGGFAWDDAGLGAGAGFAAALAVFVLMRRDRRVLQRGLVTA
jgi:hypothetical protein